MHCNAKQKFQITKTFDFGVGGREGRDGGRVGAQSDFLCMFLSALRAPELPHIALCMQKKLDSVRLCNDKIPIRPPPFRPPPFLPPPIRPPTFSAPDGFGPQKFTSSSPTVSAPDVFGPHRFGPDGFGPYRFGPRRFRPPPFRPPTVSAPDGFRPHQFGPRTSRPPHLRYLVPIGAFRRYLVESIAMFRRRIGHKHATSEHVKGKLNLLPAFFVFNGMKWCIL